MNKDFDSGCGNEDNHFKSESFGSLSTIFLFVIFFWVYLEIFCRTCLGCIFFQILFHKYHTCILVSPTCESAARSRTKPSYATRIREWRDFSARHALTRFKTREIGSSIKFVGKLEAFGPDPRFLFARVHPVPTQWQNGTHQSERKWTRRNNFLTPSLLPPSSYNPTPPPRAAASFSLPRHRSRY